MNKTAYAAAIASLPYSKCGSCGAGYYSARCPHCKPPRIVAKEHWHALAPDEAKAWLLREIFK